MKRFSYALAAAVLMFFAANIGFAQHGGHDGGGHDGDHGRDSTMKHQIDSIINSHRGSLDSLIKHHMDGDDSLHHRGDSTHVDDTLRGGHDGGDTLRGGHGDDDSTHKGDTTGHGHGMDTTHHRIGGRHHMEVDARFVLTHDSCRVELESKMTAADAQELETLIAQLKADRNNLDTLRHQLRAARKAGDSATFQTLLGELRSTLQDMRSADSSLRALLSNYQDAIVATMKDCAGMPPPHKGDVIGINARPIAPNPIRTGTTATLTYNLSADANVSITLFDAMGTQIQSIVNGPVTAGMQQVQISFANVQPGPYYIRIQAGNSVITQKVMVLR